MNTTALLGKGEEEALRLIASNGMTGRVVARDGTAFATTRDYNENRVNLYINAGKVSKVNKG